MPVTAVQIPDTLVLPFFNAHAGTVRTILSLVFDSFMGSAGFWARQTQ